MARRLLCGCVAWLAMMLGGWSQSAPVVIPREEAANIKSLDLGELESKISFLDGEIIRVRFNYREANVNRLPTGGLAGTIGLWRYRNGKSAYGTVPVNVPPAAVDWFMKITTEYGQMKLWLALVRVNGKRLELLGREFRTDSRGSTIVW